MYTVPIVKVLNVPIVFYCSVDVCKSILVQIIIIYIVHAMYTVPIVTVSAAVSVLGSVLEVATMVME